MRNIFIFLSSFLVYHYSRNDDVSKFLKFIDESPTPWHAVNSSSKILLEAGFTELDPSESLKIRVNGKYFIVKSKSTLVAFIVGGQYTSDNGGFSIIGTHVDSPNLRLKPNYFIEEADNYQQVLVQTYGSGIWYTWFDRDLYLAGLVVYRRNNHIDSELVSLKRLLLRIPTVAIHLHSQYHDKFAINRERHLIPVIGLNGRNASNETSLNPLIKLIADELNVKADDILDMEICLSDSQPASLGGIRNEFIYAPRLDNLVGTYTALKGLLSTNDASIQNEKYVRVLAMFDNEEVGSKSSQGAASNFIRSTLRRIAENPIFQSNLQSTKTAGISEKSNATQPVHKFNGDVFERALERSFLISADQGHAFHPNYPEKHDYAHRVTLDGGFILKYHVGQKYSTSAISASVLKHIANKRNITLQNFVTRNDLRSGSTIGPTLAALLNVPTVDVGGPLLSMHSIREMIATSSINQGIDLFQAFYEEYSSLNLDSL